MLADLLNEGQVVCHPFIVGELACGYVKNREEILSLLDTLPPADVAEHDEALAVVETHGLFGTGVGWIDVHLLVSAMIGGTPLWTLDRSLLRAARRLHVAHEV